MQAPDHAPPKVLSFVDLGGTDCLNWATVLFVSESERSAAEAVAALAPRHVEILTSAHAYPGRIYGFKDRKTYLPCLRIDLER